MNQPHPSVPVGSCQGIANSGVKLQTYAQHPNTLHPKAKALRPLQNKISYRLLNCGMIPSDQHVSQEFPMARTLIDEGFAKYGLFWGYPTYSVPNRMGTSKKDPILDYPQDSSTCSPA